MELIFDTDKLKKLLMDFYLLTQIKIVVFNTRMEEVVAVPEKNCSFCATLRMSPAAEEKCQYCTREAGRICRETNLIHIYECHAGLLEAVSPLKIGDVTIGYIMIGQMVEQERLPERREAVLHYGQQYGCTADCFASIAAKTSQQIHAAARLMEACASHLLMLEWIRTDSRMLPLQIADYIAGNLGESLTAQVLCREFGISKNALYDLSQRYYGVPIARYIKRKRLTEAARLIQAGVRVGEAAYRTGFRDYNYFSKVFKAEMGCAASSYRKKP